MSEAIAVTDTVRVPASALTVHAVRASGPGGQNVNKLATKVELRADLAAVEGLSAAARARLSQLARHRLDAEGRLVVTSQTARSQARNLEEARAKVAELIRAALVAPRRRRPHRSVQVRAAAAPGRQEAPGNGEALARAARGG